MKLPFFKNKNKKPETPAVPMTKQQIIPKGVSPHVRTKEEIYTQARLKTDHDEPRLVISPDVTAFLKKHGQAPEQVDMDALTAAFLAAMQKGLRGEEGGLPMLPTYLTDVGKVPNDVPVAVLDAGGSNLRAAVVHWRSGAAVVEQSETVPLPGSRERVQWADFISRCCDLLEPRLEGIAHVGVCFCYPADATPEQDVRVIEMTKEVKIIGYEGELVCAALEAELEKRGHKGLRFTALNDTPAAQLVGKVTIPPRYATDFAGMVLGTGANTCCALPVSRIEKLGRPDDDTRMLVNVESGSFTGVQHGDFERAIDELSENPGAYLFEKMVGGRYLGEICRRALVAAAEEGLFSPAVAAKVKEIKTLDTAECDSFSLEPENGAIEALQGAGEKDLGIANEIITALFRRAANAATSNIAALVELMGKPTDRYKPIITCVDGSLFNKSLLMHESITQTMNDYAMMERGIYGVCKGVEQATLVGTAAAALLHQQ